MVEGQGGGGGVGEVRALLFRVAVESELIYNSLRRIIGGWLRFWALVGS